MAANFSNTTPAFRRLLDAAGDRYDVVERALVSARASNDGQAPTMDQVLHAIAAQRGPTATRIGGEG